MQHNIAIHLNCRLQTEACIDVAKYHETDHSCISFLWV